MLCCRLTRLRLQKCMPNTMLTHVHVFPTQKSACLSSTKSSGGQFKPPDFKRAEFSAPVRYGFLPEEWFTFFYAKTGVTGPYLLGIGVINYMVSKEIYVMEHEYYLGLSIALVVYYTYTRHSTGIAKALDNEIDAIQSEWEKGRQFEIDMYEMTINAAEESKVRANAQVILLEAKKENIAMQLEAAYRDRMMHVYRTTKGRMDYHVKRYRAEAKVHQKWMIEWILSNVRKSITPEFEQKALDAAIRDLGAVPIPGAK